MNETAQCLICGIQIARADQPSHLATAHPGPFRFYHDGRQYMNNKPSMAVADLKRFVVCDPTYILYDENDVAYADGQAVDLTREPRFFSIPPATF